VDVVTTPSEILIDTLVLRGVPESDAAALVESFKNHLELLVSGGGHQPSEPRPHERTPDADGYRLALLVARTIGKVRPS
jgi:hypothetical protein